LDGFPVIFYDTAGFRETSHELEQQGMERSRQSIANADLIVWVIDLTVPSSEQPDIPVTPNLLLCFNKADIININSINPTNQEKQTNSKIISENRIIVSATTGEGLEILLENIIQRLIPNPPNPFEAVPLTTPTTHPKPPTTTPIPNH
jgi:tRNA modification GTPase